MKVIKFYTLRLTYKEMSLLSRALMKMRDSNGFIDQDALKIMKQILKEISK